MKDYDNLIDTIGSLEDLYCFVDDASLEIEEGYDAAAPFLKYRSKTQDPIEKQLLTWEIEVACFSFIGSEIFSFAVSNATQPGSIVLYPDRERMENEAITYITQRAREANSALLRGRYNQLLWQYPATKNRKFALAAYNCYCEVIQNCTERDSRDGGTISSLVARILENTLGLVTSAGIEPAILKERIKELLNNQSIPFATKHSVIEHMLGAGKVFKVVDFDGLLQLFESEIQKVIKNRIDDFMLLNYYLPTAIKISEKVKANAQPWYEQMGYLNLGMAEKETDKQRDWIKLTYYTAAIEAFRLSGNSTEKKRTEQLHYELKNGVTLEHHIYHFDDDEIQRRVQVDDLLKKKAKRLHKLPLKEFYGLLSKGLFFPKFAEILKITQDGSVPWLKGISNYHFDGNKNISKLENEQEQKHHILEVYGNLLSDHALPLLHYTLIGGIREGRITVNNFMEFLVEHTWIGKPTISYNLNGEPHQTNWIFQVAPAITEFIHQVRAWGESDYYKPSFILCTDSLALKLEGLFRSFSQRLNVSTSIGKRKGTQEALAHDILNNEAIRKYFDEDDRLLFDYVFSNEGGLNIRNNIAHCFYSPEEYHPDKMLLLLAVLLRLGKYDIKITEGDTESQ
ncbi:DUF4209 domain-containing protein [Flavobacterium zepuense]|nr:DUF4209 domain-containing protein [Flavobacterium zepuense]